MDDAKKYTYDCKAFIMAIHDVMYLLNGKWKVYIITSLYLEQKRYSDILKDVAGISGKMLSRELKEMELSQLVKRTVVSRQPVTVQYELTDYGQTLKPLIENLAAFGMQYRKGVLGK